MKILIAISLLIFSTLIAQAQPSQGGGGEEGGPPAHPHVTLWPTLATCGMPQFTWTAVAGATEYELVKDGANLCQNSVLGCGTQAYIEPGATNQFKVRPKVGGAWQSWGPTLNYTSNCDQHPARPVGQQNILAALFNFPDEPVEPITPSAMHTLLYTDFAALISTYSYGQASIVGPAVGGYFTMPHPRSYYCPPNISCNSGTLYEDASAILTGAGYNLANYHYIFKIMTGTWGVGGWANGVVSYYNGNSEAMIRTFLHEWGHSEGLQHSLNWVNLSGTDTCPDFDNPTAGGCSFGGLPWSGEPMGNGTLGYSAMHRAAMGWHPSNERVIAATGTNTYTLKALEGTVVPREIRIPIPSRVSWFYSLEYRSDGVWIWLHLGMGQWGVWPDIADIFRVNHGQPITMTNSFVDPYRGITVTMQSSNANEAVLLVTGGP